MKQRPETPKAVCVIPARGGSKRIPGKNTKPFCGKPIIQWSIEAALASGCFDLVVVSTDCEKIAGLARSFGAQVPFMRPAHLSDDFTSVQAVVKHTIESVRTGNHHQLRDEVPVCCLYATAPLVEPADLIESRSLLAQASFVLPVTSFAFPIQRASTMDEHGGLSLLSPEHYNTRSQDLEEAWHDIGQFYWATAGVWVDSTTPYEAGARGYVVPRWRVQDIDSTEDWRRAELMFTALLSSGRREACTRTIGPD